MNVRIDLKDGFCVSCGLESGGIYRSCPFCDEMVWHPYWRQLLFWYIVTVLPLFITVLLAVNRIALISMAQLIAAASWKIQTAVIIAVSVLLLPYENRRLVYTNSKSYTFWLLNALAASVLILLCSLLFALGFCFSECATGLRFAMYLISLSGLTVPLVLNCDWRSFVAAAVFAGALICV